MKYGDLNFLELSGPLQACNGTALPLLDVAVNDSWTWPLITKVNTTEPSPVACQTTLGYVEIDEFFNLPLS